MFLGISKTVLFVSPKQKQKNKLCYSVPWSSLDVESCTFDFSKSDTINVEVPPPLPSPRCGVNSMDSCLYEDESELPACVL